ncbi:hypothetical protein ACN38_g11700 [Penicillium nordicum]|uniref:Uncharacterized protein n=1 Tax=Penicillium nordicum TaxID=229535 RepID=A0A0M8NYC1_9EURO|nr:hypothetical protein ACN38_g11700 [Penicillium nordicum]
MNKVYYIINTNIPSIPPAIYIYSSQICLALLKKEEFMCRVAYLVARRRGWRISPNTHTLWTCWDYFMDSL